MATNPVTQNNTQNSFFLPDGFTHKNVFYRIKVEVFDADGTTPLAYDASMLAEDRIEAIRELAERRFTSYDNPSTIKLQCLEETDRCAVFDTRGSVAVDVRIKTALQGIYLELFPQRMGVWNPQVSLQPQRVEEDDEKVASPRGTPPGTPRAPRRPVGLLLDAGAAASPRLPPRPVSPLHIEEIIEDDAGGAAPLASVPVVPHRSPREEGVVAEDASARSAGPVVQDEYKEATEEGLNWLRGAEITYEGLRIYAGTGEPKNQVLSDVYVILELLFQDPTLTKAYRSEYASRMRGMREWFRGLYEKRYHWFREHSYADYVRETAGEPTPERFKKWCRNAAAKTIVLGFRQDGRRFARWLKEQLIKPKF